MQKSEEAVSLGKKGGQARALSLTPERRSEIAREAAHARWVKHRMTQIFGGQTEQSEGEA